LSREELKKQSRRERQGKKTYTSISPRFLKLYAPYVAIPIEMAIIIKANMRTAIACEEKSLPQWR
jgi:hypothetical protein